MQKKLLTVAVAGALAAPAIAVAQSTVEVYGTVNMAFGQFRYSEGSAPNTGSVSKWDVANGASNYGVRSRENLGGGLAGWIQIEQNAPLERSNNIAITPASRNSAIGLQGGFGNFFIGQWTTPWADLDALWGIGTVGFWGPVTSIIGRRETTGTAPNPNCQNFQSPAPNVGSTATGVPASCDAVEANSTSFWRRVSQAVFYQSPVMAGVQAKVAYQTNEGKATGTTGGTNADPSLWSFSVQWSGMGGRARVGAAYDRHKDFNTIGQTDTGYALKGGFNFGVVDVGLAFEQVKYNAPTGGEAKSKQFGVALAVPVGPGSIRASWSKAKDLTGPGIAISDTGATQYNLGYEHRFSKRTNVGVGYAKITNKDNAQFTWTGAPPNQQGFSNNPLFGSDVSTIFLSMTHRF